MHDHAWESTLLAVGLEPQLLVDNLLTASAQDATHRRHTPERSRRAAVHRGPALDGIHWSVYPQTPIFCSRGGSPGDVNILWYDEHSREFVVQHPRPPRRAS